MYIDTTYLLFMLFVMALGGLAQFFIHSQYRKYDKVASMTGLTGAQMARHMLDANGLSHLPVQMIAGTLTDNYNPRSTVVSLSQAVYNGRSVSAIAIACHECGHAVQYAQKYLPATVRNATWPVVNLVSNLWYLVLMVGFMLSVLEIVWAALLMFCVVLLYQLITLPIEFNASSRALAFINPGGYLPTGDSDGARAVLTAAALTYVAGALASILQLVYLFSRTNRRRS